MSNFGRRRPVAIPAGWGVWVLVGLAVVPYVLAWFSDEIQLFMAMNMMLIAPPGAAHPWSIITYIFAGSGNGRHAFAIVCTAYWLWAIGRPLEKDLGTAWLLGIFGISSVVHGALAYAVGMSLPGILYGVHLPAAFISIVWCARNQGEVIRLFAVIPIQGRWLAVLIAILALFATGNEAPLFGLIVCLPLILAWLYGSGKLALPYGRLQKVRAPKKEQREFDKFITNVRDREQERAEREKLRKLFEDSVSSDEDDKR